ncbi:hypothetical protein [Ornithinibacillus halotolerans]|uniref:Uncharacterized protein n=1 Tax=Ornithinibacillus halotolerans TaxID=1274357 RepID=A0A916RYZ1_9BACI|nr:hypothetical protein [Ornithinibacillus halotolerans]GGA77122.1 hypothetical protein GCM10008025_20930 [Ornithinibacillus halotolerans]
MFQQLNDEIVRVKGDMYRKKKLMLQLDDYQVELDTIQRTIHQLEEKLKDEKADVKKLEGFSITNFFSTISGTKYEKLDKENREVLAAQLQLEEAEKTRAEIEASMMELSRKLVEVENSENEYELLLEQKEQLIKNSNSRYADELYHIGDQEGDIQAYIKELNEAIEAGEDAKQALRNAVDSLNSASNWGTWDMLGGGMISSAIKHSRMDDASNHIHIAQTRMRSFQKELLDIDQMIKVDMDISGLLKFADFFFDGFIVDWMVQGRINDSLDQVHNQLAKVREILNMLEDELSDRQHKLSNLQQERKNILERL